MGTNVFGLEIFRILKKLLKSRFSSSREENNALY